MIGSPIVPRPPFYLLANLNTTAVWLLAVLLGISAYLRRRGYQFAGVAGASERVSCALTSVHSFSARLTPWAMYGRVRRETGRR